MVYDLTFNDVDLIELRRLLDNLFLEDFSVFERLVSALSRIGLKVSISSILTLYPSIEVAKSNVVKTLQKVKDKLK